ncbi:MAG: hypothetical protein ACW98F_01255 [Candidatus Hodarchaeales archaeon]|jgi:hypothetical protein
MAELQRKKEKVDKKKTSVDVLEDVLQEVITDKTAPNKIEVPRIDKKPLKNTLPKIRAPRVISKDEPPVSSISERISLSDLTPGTVHPKVKPILPGWVSKPWRWMIPEDPGLKQQWLLTWGDFLMAFARVLNQHILDLQEVSLVYPFQNGVLHKKLSLPQLKAISEHLIEQEKATWWDADETRLRVYWKTLNSFAEEIFNYSFQNGFEMITLYDMVKMNQSWSSLPPKDLAVIMKLMVKSKKATWADSEQKTIEFVFFS